MAFAFKSGKAQCCHISLYFNICSRNSIMNKSLFQYRHYGTSIESGESMK